MLLTNASALSIRVSRSPTPWPWEVFNNSQLISSRTEEEAGIPMTACPWPQVFLLYVVFAWHLVYWSIPGQCTERMGTSISDAASISAMLVKYESELHVLHRSTHGVWVGCGFRAFVGHVIDFRRTERKIEHRRKLIVVFHMMCAWSILFLTPPTST